ncbi:MAG: serine/threonine protein kinase, partial [Acidobacteria bacterium]|nr:serine/threonine protein kinase [Acidobacteriota bacterium]
MIEEGRLMARVRHPNVVTIYGAQRIAGRTGLWMEFIQGRTLEAELQDRGPLDANELTRMGVGLCHALGAVHDAGLIHRDVKAQNVMREASGRIVLGDFGTGRELEEVRNGAAELAGTPAYVAPEMFARQPATRQSDLYSLGVLLFHLATRDYPVRGGSLDALRKAHLAGRRTSLAADRPKLPATLTAAIDRALDPDPQQRFESAAAMAEALSAWLQESRRRARKRLAIGVTAVAAAVLLALIGFTYRVVTRSPVVPFEARDWVLITAFDNRTGETMLEGTIEQALEQELSTSAFVNVVPRERLDDTLQLMQRTIAGRPDAAVGREVALRDGGIRILVAGSVEKSPSGYVIT